MKERKYHSNSGFRKGHSVSREVRNKISKANKGRISWNKGKGQGKMIQCPICGKEVYRYPCQVKEGWRFCSQKCRGESMRGKNNTNWGKHLSEKTKGKIGEANKGHIAWNRGKRCPEISERQRGEKSSSWKGGISSKDRRVRASIEFRLWREAVFARDNWTCQKYGIKGGRLHPHHIKNFAQYPELRFVLDNGITFSEKAHKEFHKKYGRQNNTKEQLKEFLTEGK